MTGFRIANDGPEWGIAELLLRSVGRPSHMKRHLQRYGIGSLFCLVTTAGWLAIATARALAEDQYVFGTLAIPAETGHQLSGPVVGADFNSDGKLDLAVGSSQSSGGGADVGQVTILLGKTDGTFHPGVNYDAGNGISGIVTPISTATRSWTWQWSVPAITIP